MKSRKAASIKGSNSIRTASKKPSIHPLEGSRRYSARNGKGYSGTRRAPGSMSGHLPPTLFTSEKLQRLGDNQAPGASQRLALNLLPPGLSKPRISLGL